MGAVPGVRKGDDGTVKPKGLRRRVPDATVSEADELARVIVDAYLAAPVATRWQRAARAALEWMGK